MFLLSYWCFPGAKKTYSTLFHIKTPVQLNVRRASDCEKHFRKSAARSRLVLLRKKACNMAPLHVLAWSQLHPLLPRQSHFNHTTGSVLFISGLEYLLQQVRKRNQNKYSKYSIIFFLSYRWNMIYPEPFAFLQNRHCVHQDKHILFVRKRETNKRYEGLRLGACGDQ